MHPDRVSQDSTGTYMRIYELTGPLAANVVQSAPTACDDREVVEYIRPHSDWLSGHPDMSAMSVRHC